MILSKRIETIYSKFKQSVLAETNTNKLILKTQELIFFCWMNYPLRFTDADIEKKLEEAMLPSCDVIDQPQEQHIVYIATTLFEVGGHSRCIINFIDNQKEKKHSVILTNQKKDLPENINSYFFEQQVKITRLSSESTAVNKATKLREEILAIKPSRIYFFTHPNDVVPLITFGKFHPCERIVFNHADHVFWPGGSWFDKVYDSRMPGLLVSKHGRKISNTSLVSLPISNEYDAVERKKVKEEIGLSANDIIVGSLTNLSKVQPFQSGISIVQVIADWAVENPGIKFLIIGITSKQFADILKSNRPLPENIICKGIVANPEKYYQAFDFFIEPFPIGSGLGIIEACKYGAIPIFSPHPCFLASSYEAFHINIQQLFKKPSSISELNSNFFEMINLSADELTRLSDKLKQLIYTCHRGEVWVKSLYQHNSEPEERYPQFDLKEEAEFFQIYQGKTPDQLLSDLMKLKNLVTKKMIRSFFFGKDKIFSVARLSLTNWKQLGVKMLKTGH